MQGQAHLPKAQGHADHSERTRAMALSITEEQRPQTSSHCERRALCLHDGRYKDGQSGLGALHGKRESQRQSRSWGLPGCGGTGVSQPEQHREQGVGRLGSCRLTTPTKSSTFKETTPHGPMEQSSSDLAYPPTKCPGVEKNRQTPHKATEGTREKMQMKAFQPKKIPLQKVSMKQKTKIQHSKLHHISSKIHLEMYLKHVNKQKHLESETQNKNGLKNVKKENESWG